VIAAYVRIDGDSTDWFNGLCEFPILPPIGGTIAINDKNANHRALIVKDIVVEGVILSIREELPNAYRNLRIEIVCTEF
jgi:hypothetical protein